MARRHAHSCRVRGRGGGWWPGAAITPTRKFHRRLARELAKGASCRRSWLRVPFPNRSNRSRFIDCRRAPPLPGPSAGPQSAPPCASPRLASSSLAYALALLYMCPSTPVARTPSPALMTAAEVPSRSLGTYLRALLHLLNELDAPLSRESRYTYRMKSAIELF
eukprot:scaffold3826_cov407-Prasinococcus_capsulatus_cf.AAC.25